MKNPRQRIAKVQTFVNRSKQLSSTNCLVPKEANAIIYILLLLSWWCTVHGGGRRGNWWGKLHMAITSPCWWLGRREQEQVPREAKYYVDNGQSVKQKKNKKRPTRSRDEHVRMIRESRENPAHVCLVICLSPCHT